ncbi:MAG: hypothetical protein ACTSYA_01345 [Candidatus Kariarchaeaceae archaeon]
MNDTIQGDIFEVTTFEDIKEVLKNYIPLFKDIINKEITQEMIIARDEHMYDYMSHSPDEYIMIIYRILKKLLTPLNNRYLLLQNVSSLATNELGMRRTTYSIYKITDKI